MVVEVLSAATIDYDLGEKFEHYRRIPTLAAVVYVWQDRRRIEVRGRQGADWQTTVSGPGGAAAIPGIDCRVDVDAVYIDAGA